ncbi:MAG: hypothetical protein GC158_15225 [Cyanobacteria bacterium RI_101]|jgi:hypothetical protein|nr:hypothetical protein [Cyanobacteria bacterium RI_101]
MLSQFHYVLRSRRDGQYLTARVTEEKTYLLLFKTDYDALGYVNAQVPDAGRNFAAEAVGAGQLKGLLQRWSFHGVGVVEDILEPRVEFLRLD